MISGKPRKVDRANSSPKKQTKLLKRRKALDDEEIITTDSLPLESEEEHKAPVTPTVTFEPFEFGIIDSRLCNMCLATPVTQAEVRAKYEPFLQFLSRSSLIVNSIRVFTSITSSGSERLL